MKEQIYRRCKPEELELPFATINLYDISVNRQGKPSKPICRPEDVLYNIIETAGPNVPKYNEIVVVLIIKKLFKNGSYRKIFRAEQDALAMYLKHSPEICNFPHTVFEIVLNDTIITRENYKDTLKKKRYKDLKNECRLELHKMILRSEIRI